MEGTGGQSPVSLNKENALCLQDGEKTNSLANVNLPWHWCSFALPADLVHSNLSLVLKSLLTVVQLRQPGADGELPRKAGACLPQGRVLSWPDQILCPSQCSIVTVQLLCPADFLKQCSPVPLQTGWWVILGYLFDLGARECIKGDHSEGMSKRENEGKGNEK